MALPTPQPLPNPARRHWLAALIVAMRPHQWIKNLFVGGPLIFAKSLLDGPLFVRAALAVTIFCAISSAVYLWNDLVDIEKDRVHPRKRNRPIASGDLPVTIARTAAATLVAIGLASAAWLEWRYAAAALAYLALNVAYSLVLKRIPYLDVLSIAAGFLLRVGAGALAINVYASPWLFLCTGLLASSLGFGKRAHELAAAGARGAEQRAVLSAYRSLHLKIALYTTGVATIVAYTFYTLAAHTREFFHTDRMVWTAPAIAVGVIRYLMLVSSRPKAESPTEEILRDPLFMANLAAWAIAVVAIIYFAH